MKLFWKIMRFLVYMYYTQPSYRTSIVGKNCAYYIRIFMVVIMCCWVLLNSRILSRFRQHLYIIHALLHCMSESICQSRPIALCEFRWIVFFATIYKYSVLEQLRLDCRINDIWSYGFANCDASFMKKMKDNSKSLITEAAFSFFDLGLVFT